MNAPPASLAAIWRHPLLRALVAVAFLLGVVSLVDVRAVAMHLRGFDPTVGVRCVMSSSEPAIRITVALIFLPATGLTAEQIVALSLVYGGINVLSVLPAALLLFRPGARGEASRGV
jgi:hypothetical protein